MATYANSPLRYPGGKNKLYAYTKNLIEKNHLGACTYIEPFAGGAGLALSLLSNNVVPCIILNDIDKSIYSFWYSVLNHTDALCNLIYDTPVTMHEWYKQKEIQENKETASVLSLGFSTFFLNRTNRSGIIKGGVIGGKDQLSNYKIDCRFNKDNLIKRIQNISSFKNNISIYNLDAMEFIDDVINKVETKSFVFLDPPYYKKGPGLYENHYKHEDHLSLSNKIKSEIIHPWIVTYDNIDEIKEMYSDMQHHEYNLTYTAATKCQGKEVMFYSNNLSPIKP